MCIRDRDEHYYKSPEWFRSNASRYDKYDSKGPKVFAGEYAAHAENDRNSWEAALSEAAFITGLERNADVVYQASYAPLFAHVEGWQWRPDLIWFDNLSSCLLYTSPVETTLEDRILENQSPVILHVTA